jgi:hypothetical protein
MRHAVVPMFPGGTPRIGADPNDRTKSLVLSALAMPDGDRPVNRPMARGAFTRDSGVHRSRNRAHVFLLNDAKPVRDLGGRLCDDLKAGEGPA